MTRRLLAGVATLALAVAALSATPAAKGGKHPSLGGLSPGEFVVHSQGVPMRVVLIGFDRDQVDTGDLSALLPATYTPAVRYPLFYGLNGRAMGLEYHFTYDIVRKGRGFADRFFRHLASTGVEGPLTTYQARYNAQTKNVLDVSGPVLYIDAPQVEKWLQANDVQRDHGYTVYFVNWYGRPDFRFHVFTKTDEPDPDTGFNFGALAQNAISSWGGTSSRSWFYDFSAGPEWNMANWVVDREDLDGDDVPEYRMPAIWEYATNGYRGPAALGQDMGLLTRYVAQPPLHVLAALRSVGHRARAFRTQGRRRVDVRRRSGEPGPRLHRSRRCPRGMATLPAVLSVEDPVQGPAGRLRRQAVAGHLHPAEQHRPGLLGAVRMAVRPAVLLLRGESVGVRAAAS